MSAKTCALTNDILHGFNSSILFYAVFQIQHNRLKNASTSTVKEISKKKTRLEKMTTLGACNTILGAGTIPVWNE